MDQGRNRRHPKDFPCVCAVGTTGDPPLPGRKLCVTLELCGDRGHAGSAMAPVRPARVGASETGFVHPPLCHIALRRVRVRCLALNASFEPLTMVPVRRALRLVIEGKAEIVEADAERLRPKRTADTPETGHHPAGQVRARPPPLPSPSHQHIPLRPRQLPLPVLPSGPARPAPPRVPDAGSSDSALARRRQRVDQRGHRLQLVQHPEGEPPARGVRHAPAERSARAALRAPLLGGAPALGGQAKYIKLFYGEEALRALGGTI